MRGRPMPICSMVSWLFDIVVECFGLIRQSDVFVPFNVRRPMQSWSRHFKDTAGQDCMGFDNTAWLAESFTCLDSVQLEV